jgi:hypothetical protein
MIAAFSRHLHFQGLERTLRERHPELADRVHFDDTQGRMVVKVALSDTQSVALGHVRMGHTVVWAVVDPVLNSDPLVWPPDTPDEVLVDALHAVATAHLTGEPVPSPWRWNESAPSEMTELADLLDARGIHVLRVAAGNGYFPYGPRHEPRLAIETRREGDFLEAGFPEGFARVSLKPALGWMVDVHLPRWDGWGRVALGRCLRRRSRLQPGVPRTDLSVAEIAELLCRGPQAWETEPHWAPPRLGAPSAAGSVSALQEPLFADLPVQRSLLDRAAGGGDANAGEGLGSPPSRGLTPREITGAVLDQLTAFGFTDLMEGAAEAPIESDAFHLQWHGGTKDVSKSEMQRLNGLAAAAGEDVPKRLILITGGGLTRPAAAFADEAKAFVFHLDRTTGRLTALNRRAAEAMPPAGEPGWPGLDPW